MLLLPLICPALAFLPVDGDSAEPNRVYPEHPLVQARLAREAAWTRFTGGIGAGWQARFDERTGGVRTAWGPPIPLGDTGDGAAVVRAVRGVLAEGGLVDVDRLVLRSVAHAADTDTWYVELDQHVDGVPIWRGGVSARVRDGGLFLVHLGAYGAWQSLPATPDHGGLDADDAITVAHPSPGAVAVRPPRKVLVPWDGDGVLEPRLCWEVHTATASPPSRRVHLVDVVDGELLASWDEVRRFEGRATAFHDTRTIGDPIVESPTPELQFDGADGTTTWADPDGTYALDPATAWTTRLRSPWFEVFEVGRDPVVLPVTEGADVAWTDAALTLDARDVYVALHRVRDWGRFADATNPFLSLQIPATTGATELPCNAWYVDDTVNFGPEFPEAGCNSFGRIADVAFHEWGHGFHHGALLGGVFDGALSEGSADFVAALQTKDPAVAPGAHTDGTSIRDLGPDVVYPEDLVGEVHADGLIWGGALWDSWEALLAESGESREVEGDAWTSLGVSFARSLRAGPTLATGFDELLAADDDDADLTNGTPHVCALTEGFRPHGLTPTGTVDGYVLEALPIADAPAGVPIPVVADLHDLEAACRSTTVAEATLVWSIDGGVSWTESSMTPDGPTLRGEIPAQPTGTLVAWAVHVVTGDGVVVEAPPDGRHAAPTFYVGALELLGCEGFEEDDGGYTVTPLAGMADWEWGTPTGESGDPAAAAVGARIWGTDLGAGDRDGAYGALSAARLEAAPFPLEVAGPVVVGFRRWLTVADGSRDQARFFVDGVERWSNLATEAGDSPTRDGDWVNWRVLVEDPGSSLSLAWEIEAGSGPALGGWNLDEVCVWAVVPDARPDTAVGPADSGRADPPETETPVACGCTSAPSLPTSALLIALSTLTAAFARRAPRSRR